MECVVLDVPIHYEVVGEGRPLLMLHGLPADHHHIQHDMEPLFEHRDGWRRIYPDLPGMGATPSSDTITSHADVVDVVAAFIDTVAPGEQFVATGASYGGFVARGLTLRRAERMDGFCTYVPGFTHPSSSTLPPAKVLVPDEAVLADLSEDEALWAEAHTVHSSAALEEFRTLLEPAFAKADHAFLERLELQPAPLEPLAMQRPFNAPSLILAGRQDSWCGYVDAWAVLEDYPRATFAVLDRAAHGLSLEQRTLFRALVSEWLDRVEEFAT